MGFYIVEGDPKDDENDIPVEVSAPCEAWIVNKLEVGTGMLIRVKSKSGSVDYWAISTRQMPRAYRPVVQAALTAEGMSEPYLHLNGSHVLLAARRLRRRAKVSQR